jgi:hypothetical protein
MEHLFLLDSNPEFDLKQLVLNPRLEKKKEK